MSDQIDENERGGMDRKTLDKMTRPPVGYWFEDGLVEIAVGVLLVLIGLFFLLEGYAALGTWLRRMSGYAALSLMMIGPWAIRWILRRLRTRLTYQRTGYAALRSPTTRSRWLSMGIAALVALGTVWILGRLPAGRVDWVPLIEGLTIGGFMFYQGFLARLSRLIRLGIGVIVLGGVFASGGMGDLVGTGFFMVIVGSLLALFGYGALHRFVMAHPAETIDLEGRTEEEDNA